MPTITKRQAFWALTAITALGAAFRFYNLSWGAPFYHFHMDEHFVLQPADTLRRSTRDAAMGAKFFMYSPMMMYLINMVRSIYEVLVQQLDLTVPRDEITYMVIARAIAASFGTATILLVYAIANRIGGRAAGLLSAFLFACAVLHLRDSHFATTDMPMVFFTVLTIWWAVRVAERGDWVSMAGAGASAGAAVACKYTGAITLGAVGVAYFLAPGRPTSVEPLSGWVRWTLRGAAIVGIAIATFFILDPLVLLFPDKFLADVKEQITDPLLGVTRPIIFAQFADIGSPRLYWLSNLFWSLGPMLEILGIAGVLWLLLRRDRRAAIPAAFAIIYYLVAGRTVAPMIRYVHPLIPALAIAAGVLSSDWLASRRARALAFVVIGATIVSTALYALAYMNIFRQPDSRVEAARWLVENVPRDAKVLVEPSQNTPPMGAYFSDTNFNNDYVLWGGTTRRAAERERHDYYHLHLMDTYRYLYADRFDDEEKRRYIASRLALVDWIAIDDTYVQWYEHLPASENGVLKEHYRDLFAGTLGFALVKTFKTYPSIFGLTINDDAAEFTFKLFDHPRVYIFRRYAQLPRN